VKHGKRPGAEAVSGTRLTLRVDFKSSRSIGPGKIHLLEEIDRTGSISRAGRNLGMSYRRAWLLVDDLNHCFRSAWWRPGGVQGGGATLTAFGSWLVRDYRTIEKAASNAAKARLRRLEAALKTSGRTASNGAVKTPIRSIKR
jgi:molybdate transport system regulatory protein